jgi:hypothetical protein
MVSWCPDDEVLLAPSYGETFDGKGRLMREISLRDLDAVEVTVRRGLVGLLRRPSSEAPASVMTD